MKCPICKSGGEFNTILSKPGRPDVYPQGLHCQSCGYVIVQKMKTIPVPINRVVTVVESHGGYRGGACLACGALGWLEGKYGHRFGADVMSNRLTHERDCPMNEEIDACADG